MTKLNLFSKEDQKSRKKWRITWAFVLVFELLVAALISFDEPGSWGIFGIMAVFIIGGSSLLYYFAYHKHGNKFLSFYLFFPISQLGRQWKEIINSFNDTSREEAVYSLVILGVTLAFYGWWYYLNYRLFVINKGFNPPRACRKKIAEMQQSHTSEELEAKYQELIQADSLFEPAITVAYHQKKASLTPRPIVEIAH